MNDSFSKELDCYLEVSSNIKDKNGFTTKNKNGLAFLLFILFMILVLEKID